MAKRIFSQKGENQLISRCVEEKTHLYSVHPLFFVGARVFLQIAFFAKGSLSNKGLVSMG